MTRYCMDKVIEFAPRLSLDLLSLHQFVDKPDRGGTDVYITPNPAHDEHPLTASASCIKRKIPTCEAKV